MFNKNKFAQILKKISANYDNQRDFAKKSEINRTYLSQYMNMKIDKPPKPEILKKISDASKEITTYDELMQICGYITYLDNSQEIKELLENFKKLNLTEKEFNGITEYINKKNNISIEKNNYNSDIKDDLKYELRRKLSDKQLQAYSLIIELQFYDFSINELYKTIFDKDSINKIPILGRIPAGIPIELIEDVLDYEELSEDYFKGGKEYFGLKVKGNSMEPKYLDGDTLIILKQSDCESGQDAIVMVNGDDGTFKRVFKTDNGITLQPLNNEYMPMFYSNEDIKNKPVRILGIVKEIRRSV